MSSFVDDLTQKIADEAERIALDFEARGGGNGLVNVLAQVSMVLEAHAALDGLSLSPQMDEFARTFIDNVLAEALRARGWTVRGRQ
jgi:hypothetical protein